MELSTILIGGEVTVSRAMRLMDRMMPLLPVPEMGRGQTAFQIAIVIKNMHQINKSMSHLFFVNVGCS